jgi:ribosomal protein S18 acetylase RimI-like enzyme
VVYDTATSKLVAVCLCCGPSLYFIEVHPDYQRQGIATNMLKRALTVCAEENAPRFDLWRSDDSVAVPLYERLGFKLTGETE